MENRSLPKNFVPHPFDYRQQIELDIDDINNLGAGVGRIDGWVVTVRGALGGERVRAAVYKNHKNYSEADLLKVVRASPQRVKPVCPLYGECGGCQYQHLSYEGQLKWKRKQVADAMKRIGGISADVKPTRPSPLQYGYRSKLTPHYEKPRGEKMPIGFVRNGRRKELVDVPQCPIASPTINEALPKVRAKLLARAHKLKRGGTLLLRDCIEGVCTDATSSVTEIVSGVSYQFCAGEFFQNNPHILPELVEYAISQAAGPRFLIDAYCGVGVFALAAADRFEYVSGVEISSKAIVCANANARINNKRNCEFTMGKAEAIFQNAARKFPPSDCAAIIDPPRSGCDKSFLEQLIDFAPARIVYVSCAPDTQARDIAFLCANGYSLLELQPFDLFPQTRHIENVATLFKA